MKADVPWHRKTLRLMRDLRIPRWQAVGIVEMLWQAARRETPCGDIGKLSNEDIAASMEYADDENVLVAALTKAGWLDADEKYRLVVHDWSQHCDLWVHAQVARLKLRFTDGTIPSLRHVSPSQRAKLAAFYGLNIRQLEESQEGATGIQLDLPSDDDADRDGADLSSSCTVVAASTENEAHSRDCRAASTGNEAHSRDCRAQPILSFPIRSGVCGGVEGSGIPLPPQAVSPPHEKPEKANTTPNRRRIGFESAAEISARSSPPKTTATAEQLRETGECLEAFRDAIRAPWDDPRQDADLCRRVLAEFENDVGAMVDWLRTLRNRRPGDGWGWLVLLARLQRAKANGGGDASMRAVQ